MGHFPAYITMRIVTIDSTRESYIMFTKLFNTFDTTPENLVFSNLQVQCGTHSAFHFSVKSIENAKHVR